jgi:DNA-binding MarR family transcriptional regulator
MKQKSEPEGGVGRKAVSQTLQLAPELDEAVGFWIRRAVNVADELFDEHFAPLEIGTQQYAIMMTVLHNPGCQPSALSAMLGITPNNLVPQIDSLVRRGFIRRSLSTVDRRIRHLRLTPTGERFAEQLVQQHKAIRVAVEARLSSEGADQMRELLQRYVGRPPGAI